MEARRLFSHLAADAALPRTQTIYSHYTLRVYYKVSVRGIPH